MQVVGDADAGLRRQYVQVFRYVRRRTRSQADAEDVVQDVFAAAARGLRRPAVEAPPTLAWLYTVAQRRLADAARRRARTGHEQVSLQVVHGETAAGSEYGGAVASALRAALASLAVAQRQVIVLRLLEGRSFREIAEVAGASEAACKMRFARGLEHLRDDLERKGIGP